MTLLLEFAVTLVIAVLVSGLAHRSILSTAVIFLAAGALLGNRYVGALTLDAEDAIVTTLAEFALFSVLFTDGMRVGIKDLVKAWRLPGRALLLGMPLTWIFTAMLAYWITGLDWTMALLVGAILSPTDPVFAAAIVGREEVPQSLRRLLNVESGINDGLALPVVVLLIDVLSHEPLEPTTLALEIIGGIVIGIVIPYLVIKLEQSRFFDAATAYEPINAFAIGLVVLALAKTLHQNEFLAAFAAGVTVATIGPEVRESFHKFGELVTELLKLAALLLFGALVSLEVVGDVSWQGLVFAIAALLVVRPVALSIALLGSSLSHRERLVAAWFGPKGFASVVYGLLLLKSGVPESEHVFHLIGFVVALSIVAHSSTDVLVAKWFRHADSDDPPSPPDGEPAATIH